MAHIKSIVPVKSAVNRLRWTVSIPASDFPSPKMERGYLLDWDGYIEIQNKKMDNSFYFEENESVVKVRAHWNRTSQNAKKFQEFSTHDLVFETDLLKESLDYLEEFRGQSTLYARLFGRFYVIHKKVEHIDSSIKADWLPSLVAGMDFRYNDSDQIVSEPREISRDEWCNILKILRPPGRISFDIPLTSINEKLLKDAHDVSKAFEDGKYEEVARLSYNIFEELKRNSSLFESKYSEYGKKRIEDQIKPLIGFCNPTRHADDPKSSGCVVDRALARHLLGNVCSLLSMLG